MKSEYFSLSLCVINDSVFYDVEGGVFNIDVELFVIVYVNFMCGVMKGDDFILVL